MGFRKDAWASVWSVEEGRGNTMKVRISTSRKKKDTDEYEQDFSGFCTFIGNAKAKVPVLEVEGIRMELSAANEWIKSRSN